MATLSTNKKDKTKSIQFRFDPKQKKHTIYLGKNSKKASEIIEDLILAFQDMKIMIPCEKLFPELKEELSDFSFTYNKKTRHISYAARTGHDDTVMSLAIAWYAKRTGLTKGVYAVH